MRRYVRKTFGIDPRDPFGQRQQRQQQQQPPRRPQEQHKKKIDPEVGEYVEFTETTVTHTTVDPDGSTSSRTATEQQITDVQWEELPPEQ